MANPLDPELAAFARDHGIAPADVERSLEEVLAFVAAKEPSAKPDEARAIAKGVILGLEALTPRKALGSA